MTSCACLDHATKWVVGYLSIIGRKSWVWAIANETPEVLFQRYVRQQLSKLIAPGLSLDECGIQAVNRKKAFNTWDEFPTPTWVAGTIGQRTLFRISLLTNSTFHSWNPTFPAQHVFNEAQIQVTYFGTNLFDTHTLRSCDLHDRPF